MRSRGREVPASGSPLPAVRTTPACPSCGVVLDPDGLRHSLFVCGCGHHFRLPADAWVALLASPGTWEEEGAELRPLDVLSWREPRPYRASIERAYEAGLNESVRTGACRIGGHRVWLAVFDFRFIGGSLSAVAGERIARSLERAAGDRAPYVAVSASGGARMQEGTLALLQMAKVNAALHTLQSAGLLYLSVLTDPTFGGTAASLSLLGDVNVAEPSASVGFTGARVIQQATNDRLPEGFQTAEFQRRRGQVDMVVPRAELRQTVVRLLDLFVDV